MKSQAHQLPHRLVSEANLVALVAGTTLAAADQPAAKTSEDRGMKLASLLTRRGGNGRPSRYRFVPRMPPVKAQSNHKTRKADVFFGLLIPIDVTFYQLMNILNSLQVVRDTIFTWYRDRGRTRHVGELNQLFPAVGWMGYVQ